VKPDRGSGSADETLEKARKVKRQHERRWLDLEGVVAVGVGSLADGGPGIVVSVQAPAGRLRRRIPEAVEGVRIEVRETGPIRAQ
jgi:hypothetical protein